ncbi:MAG: tetratricopeptide repeat protein [Candidatus Aminicenantes bacterium]|nr:tetratricopeptide repeat protein [Candidatus Aminicenantes bacterium]
MRLKQIIMVFMCLSLTFCASSQRKIQKAREKDPRFQHDIGLTYLQHGDPDEAIQYFKKALDLNPRFNLALNSLGLAYTFKGSFQNAITAFKKCLEINPTFTEAHNNLGIVYHEMGLIDKAEAEYQIALSDDNYKSKYNPYYNLARIYLQQDKAKQALFYIDKAIQIYERMVMAHYLRGVIQERLGNFDEALKSLKNALDILDPSSDDIEIKFKIAEIYFKTGKHTEAKNLFLEIKPLAKNPQMVKKIEDYLRMIGNA